MVKQSREFVSFDGNRVPGAADVKVDDVIIAGACELLDEPVSAKGAVIVALGHAEGTNLQRRKKTLYNKRYSNFEI